MVDHTSDIMQKAREAAAEWDRMNWSEYEGNWHEDMAASFAAAIMTERDRCEQIAETCPDEPFAKHGQWHGTLRKSIVAAIRSPERAGE